jgi:hypothetical protein
MHGYGHNINWRKGSVQGQFDGGADLIVPVIDAELISHNGAHITAVHSVMTFVVSTKKNGLYIEPTKHVNKSRI